MHFEKMFINSTFVKDYLKYKKSANKLIIRVIFKNLIKNNKSTRIDFSPKEVHKWPK